MASNIVYPEPNILPDQSYAAACKAGDLVYIAPWYGIALEDQGARSVGALAIGQIAMLIKGAGTGSGLVAGAFVTYVAPVPGKTSGTVEEATVGDPIIGVVLKDAADTDEKVLVRMLEAICCEVPVVPGS